MTALLQSVSVSVVSVSVSVSMSVSVPYIQLRVLGSPGNPCSSQGCLICPRPPCEGGGGMMLLHHCSLYMFNGKWCDHRWCDILWTQLCRAMLSRLRGGVPPGPGI